MIESVGVEKRPPEPSEGSIPALPRKIVLAFDVSGDLENAKRAAAAFVRERMEPGDSAAIVTVGDGRRVTLAHGFLEDREDLAGQIRSVAPATGPGKRDSIAETTEPSAGGQARDAGSPATRAKSLGASLEELARALAAVPGPKQVVLFSPGEPGAGSARLAFRRAQCEVDSILVGRIAPAGSPLSGTPDADALVKAGVASLGTLSRSTGGALLQSGNDLEERLGRMLRAGNVVYVIAFAPVATGHPGRLHSVRVRVNKRGSRVVCRRGYLEPGS
jgi:VWFA-related protein